jgi:DNA recombination-dependent growth factor C
MIHMIQELFGQTLILEHSMQGKQIGLIAQDVEKVLPSVVVTEANTEKTKGMKYAELIPVLIKAMQEQQVEIQKQQVEIDALKQVVERPTHP